MSLSKLIGLLWGSVYPPREARKAPHTDPRTYMLRALRDYVCELTFCRAGNVGEESIPFRIEKKNFHIERPDNIEDVVFPAMVAVSTDDEVLDSPGLVSDIDESTADVYGKGTVLQVQHEHIETFTLEMWATSRAERRALIAGMIEAMTPCEDRTGVMFRVPEYFNRTVRFTPESINRSDEEEVVRGRRVARMRITMEFEVVRLVNYATLNPYIIVDMIEDPNTPLVTRDKKASVPFPVGNKG